MRGRAFSAAAIVAAAVTLAAARPLEETTCRGTLRQRSVDNVRVPDGAACTMNGTVAQGTVKVGTGASLDAIGVRVIGNVQAESARSVVVRGNSFVGGSIQVVQGGSARIVFTKIQGDILFDENKALLVANDNVLGGNLQAFKNTGGLTIRRNQIDGNLQCKENRPPPTGGGNVVHGNKQDQCARL